MKNVIQTIHEEKLIGIIREDDTKKAIEIANAYIEGGIKVIEMAANIEAVKKIAENENIFVAKSGIITREQALEAINANSKLLVSPILQMGLVKLSSGYKTPLILTATTPNEAYQAWHARIPLIKIYPITDLGGAKYIEELLRPMKFLNLIPTGSIKVNQIKEYLKSGATAVGLGHDLYHKKSYEEIKEIVKFAVKEAKSI